MNKRTFIKSTVLGTLGSIFFPMPILLKPMVGVGSETSFPNTKLYINCDGNVGLNTPHPMCKFYVIGYSDMEKI